MIRKLSSFFLKCKRVWHVLRKPTGKEFKMVAKISILGILAIGLIGFVIALLLNVFK